MNSEKEIDFTYPKKSVFKIKSKPTKIGHDSHSSIVTAAFDPEGKYLALGTFDGGVKIHFPSTGKVHQIIASSGSHSHADDENPKSINQSKVPSTTSLRWKPSVHEGDVRASTILSQTLSDGTINHWNIVTNKLVKEITDHRENEVGMFASDYSFNGKYYVAAGTDMKVYLYDGQTKELARTIHSVSGKVASH